MYPQEREVKRLGIHKGTKLTDTPKDRTLKFRYDIETAEELEYLSEKTNRTKAQVIRDGIRQQYAEAQEKE